MSQTIQTTTGDLVHQILAIHYYRAGTSPAEVIALLKKSNYQHMLNGQVYRIKSATAIANIMVGLAIASPAKSKKLSAIDDGTSSGVPSITTN